MRHGRKPAALLLLLCGLALAARGQEPGAAPAPAKTPAPEAEMIRPSDFVADFPGLKWGMSFQEAKQAIERSGARPVGLKGAETEMAWDATFDGMRGRGAVFFGEGEGLRQIAVGVYAMEKLPEVSAAWLKKLTDRHGAPAENYDDEFAVTRVWRLRNGFALQLRTLKGAESPVVEITWVKG